jgi:hypothetical protein
MAQDRVSFVQMVGYENDPENENDRAMSIEFEKNPTRGFRD